MINKAIYEISQSDYAATLKELDELLDLQPVLKKQVRKLSLGERMKCELSAALLHRPKVLFLVHIQMLRLQYGFHAAHITQHVLTFQ